MKLTESTIDLGGYPLTPAQVLTSTHGAAVFHEMIAQRAFVKWQSRGCTPGTALRDWLEAEAEVKAEIAYKRRGR